MDENAKKNERELRKYRAKLRMDYYPLPLRWFKFFRYVSMILNIINCISGIISYILIAATINNPEAIEKIQAAFAEMSGTSGMNMELFTVIAVADFSGNGLSSCAVCACVQKNGYARSVGI